MANSAKPKTEEETKKGVDLDELQEEAEKLVKLLRDRERGLMSWNMMLQDRLENMHRLTSDALGK